MNTGPPAIVSRRMMVSLCAALMVWGAWAAPGRAGPPVPGDADPPTARATPGGSPGRACAGIRALQVASPPAPLRSGEELGWRLTVAGAYVGKLETKVGRPREVNGRTLLPLFGRARTTALVASIKPFVGRYMTMVDPADLRPIGLQTELTYGDDPRWEKVRFRKEQRQVEARYFAAGKKGRRGYLTDHGATDLLTLLYTARRIRISEGDSACQDVFGARRLWRMTGRVTGTTEVSTPVGKKEAHRLELRFVRKPHPSLRRHDPPTYDLVAFVSKDSYRTPLRFEVKLSGITAVGHLDRWTFSGSDEDWAMFD